MGVRAATAAFALVVLAAAAADAKVRTVKSLDGVDPGRRVRMEGVVSSRGSTPFAMLVLEVAGGEPVTIQPHTPAIQHELTNLGGVRVAVEGEVLPLIDAALPRLDVDAYEIVASGSGDPIVGMVTLDDDACVLTTGDGKRYWIVGELAPALCLHAGARVWMVGKKAKHTERKPPPGSTAFTPTGYGVIE